MDHMRQHTQWFNDITDGASGRSAAIKADLPIATLNRQLKLGHLSAEIVIALSRAYGIPASEGLLATGYLTPSEAALVPIDRTLRQVPGKMLIQELSRRANGKESDDTWLYGTADEWVLAPGHDAKPPQKEDHDPHTNSTDPHPDTSAEHESRQHRHPQRT